MSSVYVHVQLDGPDVAEAWRGAIAARLRATANLIERAGGPLSVTDDWPNLESWAAASLGPYGALGPAGLTPGSAAWRLEREGRWPPADADPGPPPFMTPSV